MLYAPADVSIFYVFFYLLLRTVIEGHGVIVS